MSNRTYKGGNLPKMRFTEFREGPEWEDKRISDFGEICTGGTPSTSNPDYWGNEYVWITPTDISERKDISASARGITRFGLDVVGRLPRNTLLVTCIASIGKNAVLRTEGGCNQQINALIPNGEYDTDFLYYLFEGNKQYLLDQSGMSATRIISKSRFLELKFLAPRLSEQKRIADCLSSLDELIASQAQKLDGLKAHEKCLMQQLFPEEGESVPKLRFPEFRDAPEWEEAKLGDLFHFQDGFAFHSTDFVVSSEDAIQVIRITDINNRNTNKDKVYIQTALLNSINNYRYNVENGDLLLSLTGAAGFNFFFWNGGRGVINQRTSKITPKKKVNCALSRLLEPLVHDKINVRGEGQNNNLSREFLCNVSLFIPQPAEQHRIGDCLTSIYDLISAQAQEIESLQAHKKGLMQQLFPSADETTDEQ